MIYIWCAIALALVIAGSLWFQRRGQNQAEAVKQYILETSAIEKQLALINPRLARGQRLEPDEQAWLEKMLYERRITSDPKKWARQDMGYDAISGTLGEFFAAHFQSGGSPELLEIKAEQVRLEKMQRMIADIGMPENDEQIAQWWSEHSNGNARSTQDPVQPGQRIYHATVVREPVFPSLYDTA